MPTTEIDVQHELPLGYAPRLPEHYALKLKHLLLCMGFGVFFIYLNYIPLFHSDIWGHVNYGKWILEHQALPDEDPFTPLAEGVPVVDTAWGGQVLYAWAMGNTGSESWGEPAWVSNVFALAVIATFLVYARAFYLRTGSLGAMTLGCLVAWMVGFSRHAIVRPEVFGGLCFALTFWLVSGVLRQIPEEIAVPDKNADAEPAAPSSLTAWLKDQPWRLWLGVPVVFAAWANLHGSFMVGLAVLGCLFAGRLIEVAWATWSIEGITRDVWVRRWLVAMNLAAAAVLLNPYGIDLYVNVLTFSKNENLKDVIEWFPVKLMDWEGIHFSLSTVLLLVLFRHSRARVRAADVLMLGLFAVSLMPTVRMIGWYAPVFAFFVLPHIAEVVSRLWQQYVPEPAAGAESESLLTVRSFRYTMLCGFVLWVCFAFSPTGSMLLGSQPRKPELLYSRGTPRSVTKYLRDHEPKGQIWNPQWWGDWIVLDGPKNVQVFMTTNAVHVAPKRVWKDYMTIANAQSGWDKLLDRYHIDTIIVHKELQPGLAREVKKLRGWKVVLEEEKNALIAVRNVPKATTAKPDEKTESAMDADACEGH